MITLVPIKGAPGYRIDMENEKVYSYRNGNLKELAVRTIYKSLTLHIDGKLVGSTVYRLMYAVQNGLDLLKIPEGLCIGKDADGNIRASVRSQLAQRAIEARWKNRPQFSGLCSDIELIKMYYNGQTFKLLEKLHKIEKKVKNDYVFMHGFSEEKADIISSMAIDSYLDSLANGKPSVYIQQSISKYARFHSFRLHRLRCRDDGRVIRIES